MLPTRIHCGFRRVSGGGQALPGLCRGSVRKRVVFTTGYHVGMAQARGPRKEAGLLGAPAAGWEARVALAVAVTGWILQVTGAFMGRGLPGEAATAAWMSGLVLLVFYGSG